MQRFTVLSLAARAGGGRWAAARAPLRAALVAAAVVLSPAGARAEPIEVAARPVPLVAADAAHQKVGALDYRGGIELSSPDPRFGGLSDLRLSADGAELLAVSDQGHWFGARLVYDDGGRLAGVADAWIAPLRGLDGAPLTEKRDADAEALAALAGGGYLVAFERRHRLWRYDAPDAPARAWPAPNLSGLPENGGIEALDVLADGRALALSESHVIFPGSLAGWLIGAEGTVAILFPGDGIFKPTALAAVDDGRVVVLERAFSVTLGPRARIVMLDTPPDPEARAVPRELARLVPPVQLDNFEGLAVRRGAGGELLLMLVSDDNFSANQRTLLMMFAVDE